MKLLNCLIFIIALCSCKSDKQKKINYDTKSNLETLIEKPINQPDSIKNEMGTETTSILKFEVDNYPISNEMIKKQSEKHYLFKVKSGKTYSIEKSWFKNDSINQTIIIDLATDYHRYFTYHFDNQNVPTDLILDIGFHTDKGELAKPKDIKNDFQGFIELSEVINSSFFKSKKGVEIGLSLKEVIEIYNKPDTVYQIKEFSKAKWDFVGDEFYINQELNNKPVAKNSFGHSIIMYFKEDKLVAQILINEIP